MDAVAVNTCRKALVSCIGAAMLLAAMPPQTAQADINDAIAGLYDGMSATAPSGAWESQRRGIISGGGVRTRVPVVNEQLINIQTPTVDGGCGGIDMFAGSAAFINADQLIQLFRNIASNAKAYAFHIALQTVFAEASAKISDLQEIVQELNALSMDSCEWAQGLVEPGADALENAMGMELRGRATDTGAISGFMESIANIGGTGGIEKTMSEGSTEEKEAVKEQMGNVVWKAMKKNGIEHWSWLNGAGGESLLESIMSMTGTMIIGSEDGGETRVRTSLSGPYLTLRDVVEGGDDIQTIKCNDSDCDSPTLQAQDIEGLSTRIETMLNGDANNNGLIYYYNSGHTNGYSPNSDETAFITNLPYSTGSMIRQLAVLNESSARMFVQEHSKAIALDFSYDLATKMVRSAKDSLEGSDETYSNEVRTMVNNNYNRLTQEHNTLQSKYGSLTQVMSNYKALIESLRKNEYTVRALNNTGRGD